MKYSTRGVVFGLAGLLILACGSCGNAIDAAGHYEGTCNGTMWVAIIPVPVNGTISFDLHPSGGDVFQASGQLTVRRTSDGAVTYQATVSGTVKEGKLNLTFTATDGKSSGTMSATFNDGCWPDGSWTITGFATTGSGAWNACRR